MFKNNLRMQFKLSFLYCKNILSVSQYKFSFLRKTFLFQKLISLNILNWEYNLIININNQKLCIFLSEIKNKMQNTAEILETEIKVFYILFFISLIKNSQFLAIIVYCLFQQVQHFHSFKQKCLRFVLYMFHFT